MAGGIEWAMWANEQAYQSSLFILLGAIIGVAGDFLNWQFAACAIPLSVITLLLEYPRSKRVRGSTRERRWQVHLTKLLNCCQPVSSNYYFRFILHMIFSIPTCFLLPTIMGGLGLMLAALIYLIAAIKGEQWKPLNLVSDKPDKGPLKTRPSAPKRAPPRHPGHDNIAMDVETEFNQV